MILKFLTLNREFNRRIVQHILLTCLVFSCVTQKQVEYLQDKSKPVIPFKDADFPGYKVKPNYNLRPNDIVYVKPMGNKFWGMRQFPFNVIFSTLTTGILLYNVVR